MRKNIAYLFNAVMILLTGALLFNYFTPILDSQEEIPLDALRSAA